MIRTQRLILRQWKESDREPFAAMSADPEVMEYFPSPLSRVEAGAFVDRVSAIIEDRGYGLWAAEMAESSSFIGLVGLAEPSYQTHFTPCVEIGWRLARPFWGLGLATEAAQHVLARGFKQLDLEEIVSFTAVLNARSMKVMERIGMRRDPDGDFDHPALENGHRLQRHVLYRLARKDWEADAGIADQD